MPIEIQCSKCNTRYRVGEDKAGKRMRCKNCQEVMTVPEQVKDELFNVFDSAPADQLYGKKKSRHEESNDPFAGSNDPFASVDDPFADPFRDSFDMEAAFKEAPTMPPAGGTPKKKSKSAPPPPSGQPDMMMYIGIGALVVIGLAVGAFVFFAGDRDNGGNDVVDNGGKDVPDNGGNSDDGPGQGGSGGGGPGGRETVGPGPASPIRAQVGFGNVGPNPVIRTESGEITDRASLTYAFDGQAGHRASVAIIERESESEYVYVNQPEFDIVMSLNTPSGRVISNDDWINTDTTLLQLALPETGQYTANVSSLDGVAGNFDLEIALSSMIMAQVQGGDLASSDAVGNSGAYEDTFIIAANRGARVRLQLSSDDFDTLLRLRGPDGSLVENDDVGNGTDSWINAVLPVDGQYDVVVTSFDPRVTGAYMLLMDQTPPGDRIESGSLAFSDQTLETGEYIDTITFSGVAGKKVNITATSGSFDTYLILMPPVHEQYDNDDSQDTNAEMSLTLPDTGEYRVLVTSNAPGEMGDYLLSIDFE